MACVDTLQPESVFVITRKCSVVPWGFEMD